MRLRILRICFVIVYALLNWNKVSHAQCPNGEPFQTVTKSYTTNLASLTDVIYAPIKFNPADGTLMAVDLSISTLGYALLEVINDVGAPITYKITYFRTDYISGPGLGGTIMLDTAVVFPNINIGASDNPAVETSTPPWASNGPNVDHSNYWAEIQAAPVFKDTDGVDHPRTFTQAVDPSDFGLFTGAGSVIYNYDVIASLLAQGIGGRYTQRIVTLNTEVTVSATYTYCPMSVLPEGKLTFSARKAGNSNIELSWIKEREENDILYTPEVSLNGYNFGSIGAMQSQMPASHSTVVKYEFDYAVPSSANGKIYFRLKQTDARGKVQYSAIVSVNVETPEQTGFSIFPNPAEKEITLQFNSIPKHNLQVELVNSTGQVVEKSNIAPNGGRQYKLSFIKRYQSGLYFVLVTNTATKSRHISRLLIR
ncbi:T9SS type A sorting domain-containing protein [Agriterribacter sp.]|uniref:T9SS type A sorting domain-containing protein n=1 Tax=Agriterribacter sp. TaxID=2821509 RepID=UPI002C89C451|nr:T9SS type A sorting domain-containing protein [Agriterribacter sp.]HRP54495.1 T9SS type A sorting domain-containing protein [Agriterribacter sp.]